MSTKCGPNIITDGLVLYLDAANSKSYPGSGTVWYDLSGYGNNTSIITGIYNSNGYFESSGEAPSTLSFFTSNSASLYSTLSVTLGGWTIEEIVLIDDTTYPESTAGTTFGTTVYNIGSIGFDWGHGNTVPSKINMYANDGTTRISGDIILNTTQSKYDKLIHRCFVYDRTLGEIRVYYNGIYQNKLNISTITGRIYNSYGISWGTLYGWQHDGYRSGMRIYNKILSLEEIEQNFNATKTRYEL